MWVHWEIEREQGISSKVSLPEAHCPLGLEISVDSQEFGSGGWVVIVPTYVWGLS